MAGEPPWRAPVTAYMDVEKMTFHWTTERTNTLMKMWNTGLSTREIGLKLGVTKNAVVGKAHRLGLAKRDSPIGVKIAPVETVRMEKLRAGMCSWPVGEPGTPNFHFCGRPAVADKPYCPEHCAKAYVKPSKERKDVRLA